MPLYSIYLGLKGKGVTMSVLLDFRPKYILCRHMEPLHRLNQKSQTQTRKH